VIEELKQEDDEDEDEDDDYNPPKLVINPGSKDKRAERDAYLRRPPN
jgi:hypothetical protein